MLKHQPNEKDIFDKDFPKTGGGEDIQACIKLKESNNNLPILPAPKATAIHPWWENNKLLVRTYLWALGDYNLIWKNPKYTYYSFPNLIEMIFINTLIGIFYML